MSRMTFSALLLCMCLCLGASSFGRSPQHKATTFSDTTTNQVVAISQLGSGSGLVASIVASIPQPSFTNLPPAAVVGNATNPSGSSIGVLGTSTGSFGFGVFGIASGTPAPLSKEEPTGVLGLATGTSGKTRGVNTHISSPDGIAIQATSTGGRLFVGASGPSDPEITDKFTVDGNGNITASGNLSLIGSTPGDINAGNGNFLGGVNSPGGVGTFASIQGQNGNFVGTVFITNLVAGTISSPGLKSAIVKVSGGRTVALYAMESPENWFEDFGTAQLDKGTARVNIDPLFAETVNSDLSYHVFLTPNGDCRGLYIAERTASGFVVRELGGGESNVAFDYRIVVRRKGYEKLRLAEVPVQQAAAPALKGLF